MALTLREVPVPQQSVASSPQRSSTPGPNRPFRDNTKLLLVGIGVLLVALASLLALASRSATLAPDFLTEVVLYALSATNLTILVALVFVLARNIVKLLVEKRRALPFAHFRAKLVAVLLGMTLIPAVLVLLVGSGLIRTSVDRWFNAPVDDVLSSANAIAGDYYQERQRLVSVEAERLAAALGELDLSSTPVSEVQEIVEPGVLQQRLGLVEVYRVESAGGAAEPRLIPIVDVGMATLPRTTSSTVAAQLVARAAAGNVSAPVVEPVPDGGDLIRSAVPVRLSRAGRPQGVVIASEYVTGQFAARASDDAGVRGLPATPRAAAAAGWRVSVFLSHPDAHDSGRGDMDGALPGKTHHEACAAARGRRQGNWSGAPRPSRRSRDP